jgi:GNAT superfamily N-acetyltransferase
MSFKFKYRQYAKTLHSALTEDAFYITMEASVGNGESATEAMLRYMEFSMLEAEKSGELYIPDDHKYGVSIWSKPISHDLERQKQQEKKKFLLNEMGRKSLETYTAIVDFMSAKAEPFINEDFWYLSIIGILPAVQGQGLGPALITNVLEKTDSLNVPTFLETFTQRNMTFYERLGYRSVQSFDEPTTKATYWLMIREPATTSPKLP